jgi:hypothetical protein
LEAKRLMKSFQDFLSEEAKASKESVDYQDNPKGKAKCSNCTMWVEPNACTAVKGKICPDGWCKLHKYEKKD